MAFYDPANVQLSYGDVMLTGFLDDDILKGFYESITLTNPMSVPAGYATGLEMPPDCGIVKYMCTGPACPVRVPRAKQERCYTCGVLMTPLTKRTI